MSDYNRNTRSTGTDGAKEVYVEERSHNTSRDTHHEKKGGLGRTLLLLLILLALAALAAVAFGLLDVDQVRQAKLPEVKVEGGQAPAFDVDTADVNVKTEKTTVEVPTLEVEKAEEK